MHCCCRRPRQQQRRKTTNTFSKLLKFRKRVLKTWRPEVSCPPTHVYRHFPSPALGIYTHPQPRRSSFPHDPYHCTGTNARRRHPAFSPRYCGGHLDRQFNFWPNGLFNDVDYVMNRSGRVQTVRITQVIVDEKNAQMRYYDLLGEKNSERRLKQSERAANTVNR